MLEHVCTAVMYHCVLPLPHAELPQEDEDEEEEEEEDNDFKVALDEDEMSIYRYLKDDALLPEEQVVALVEKFWKEEPYKYTVTPHKYTHTHTHRLCQRCNSVVCKLLSCAVCLLL